MDDSHRFQLLRTYKALACRVGQWVRCQVLGDVEVVGYSEAKIPWPLTRRGKWRVPIVFCGLAQAVRRESEIAVSHWWGVGSWSVRMWRRALGVGATTAGTSRLRRDHFAEPWGLEARRKAHAENGDPVRRAKLSGARRGRPQPRHVIEAMAAAARDETHTRIT
jgi:hypothetical protein